MICVHRFKRFASGRRCVRHVCAKIQLPRRNGRSPGRSAAAPRRSAAFFERPRACQIFLSHSVPQGIESPTLRARRYRGLPPPTLRTSVFLGENSVLLRKPIYFSRATGFRHLSKSAAVMGDFLRKCMYSAPSRPDLPYFLN